MTAKLSQQHPKPGELVRMPAGSVAFYEVRSYRQMGQISGVSQRAKAKVKQTAWKAVSSGADSTEALLLIRVEVVEQGGPKKSPPGRPKAKK